MESDIDEVCLCAGMNMTNINDDEAEFSRCTINGEACIYARKQTRSSAEQSIRDDYNGMTTGNAASRNLCRVPSKR